MGRKRFVIVILIILIPIVLVSTCEFHDTSLNARFGAVSVGMTRQEVIDALGLPSREEPCGAPFTPLST